MTKEIRELVEYNCSALKNSSGTYREIYEVMFRLRDNVMYETDDGYRVESTTFGEAKDHINAFSEVLYETIGATHEYVALEMDNGPEWIIAFWSILRSGNKPYLVNLRHPKELSEGILKTLGIRYIIGIKNTKLKGEFIDYNLIDRRAVKRMESAGGDVGSETAEDGAGSVAAAGKLNVDKEFENEIALSTSATTLKETICFYSGEKMTNQLLNTKAILSENKRVSTFYNGEIKQLVFLPLYHIFGLVAVYFWFSYFARIMVFMKDYSAESILNAVKLHEVTHIFAVPIFWNTIEKEIRKKLKERGPETEAKFEKGIRVCTKLQNTFPYAGARWSKKIMHEVTDELFGPSVLFCITGGSYLKNSTLEMFNGLGYPLFNGYGMSEIGITSVELAATPKVRNLNSIGRPFEGVEYRLNEEGVLLVKSASTCSARMIDGQMVPMDEWFETGDILEERNGRYYVLGRKGDAVIGENGENINPDVVEQAFDMHDVLNFSVLGFEANLSALAGGKRPLGEEGVSGTEAGTKEAEDRTETLTMVVQLARETTEEEVQGIIRRIYEENGTLPLTHQVKEFYFTYDAIMKETAIKVSRKYLLREIENGSVKLTPFADFKVEEMAEEKKEPLTSEIAEKVRAIIAEGAGCKVEEVGDDDHLMNDLGCDSLTYYGILIKVCNEFDVDINGPVEGKYYTMRDIVTALEKPSEESDEEFVCESVAEEDAMDSPQQAVVLPVSEPSEEAATAEI